MRVALLHPTYWPEVRRGSERHLHDLAAGLADRGHAPRIVTSHAGPGRVDVEGGVPVVRLPRPRGVEGLLRARRWQEGLAHVPAAWATVRFGRDDLVHSFWVTDAAAATRTGRPAVFSYMGIPGRASVAHRRGRLALLQDAVARSAAVTALSAAARDAMWRWLGVEARVLHPGVDLTAFRPGGTRDPAPTLACAAEAEDPRKRVGLLAAAFAEVRRTLPNARLLLYDSPAARALAGPGIELLAPEEPVAGMFARAWATALVSRQEAFGLVLVESLACGRPVVAVPEGGPAEILGGEEGIGVLTEEEDPWALARALLDALELAEDPGTEQRCRARAEVFSLERCARAHEELYAEIIERGATTG